MTHDSPFLDPLLRETADVYSSVDLVCLDEAFLSRDNCDLIEKVGAVPRISPKQGITLKRKGSWAWTEMLLDFIENPQKWLREYHLRSISETVLSTYERKFPVPIRRRIPQRKKTEAFSRVCGYNLRQLCYLRYLKGLAVHWRTN